MIVGFDGTVLQSPKTGIGYYTHFLIQRLQLLEDVDIRLFNGLQMKAVPSDDQSGEERRPTQRRWEVLRKSMFARALWQTTKAASFRRVGDEVDLFHATNYLPPSPTKRPWLPLIHDVSFLRHPEWHAAEWGRLLTSRAGEFSQAPLIHTVSWFSASEIEALLDIPSSRIRVSYPGINPIYENPASPRNTKVILSAVGVVPGQFFLSVGTLEPRKNLATVIAAFETLPASRQARFPLLVAGLQGRTDLQLPPGAATLVREGSLRFLGHLDEVTLQALYQECTAFLFPSSYEGFGMPVSEAMAMGARPIIAKGSSSEEIAGGYGVAVDAFDPDAWRNAMVRATEENWHGDAALRRRLRRLARSYSWADNTATTYRLYNELLALTG